MAHVIIVDGPEAAGKSTFIKRLWTDAPVRRWGPVDSISIYRPALSRDCLNQVPIIVWDRSWASEVVYNKLLQRGRESTAFELEREYLEGYAILKIMVLTPPLVLQARREERLAQGAKDDLPVSPWDEYAAFRQYAAENNWAVMKGNTNNVGLAR